MGRFRGLYMFFNERTPVDSTTFTTSIRGTNAWRLFPTNIYILSAQCAMVERPGLGPELCDYQSQVLTNYTTSPYDGAFLLPTQAPSAGTQVLPLSNLPKGSRIKAHRVYLVNLYTVPSVRFALHSISLNFIARWEFLAESHCIFLGITQTVLSLS